tara:strand:- start:2147 stop:2770 length:624 start_codon:yes stop_codon:yes gene_type:complete
MPAIAQNSIKLNASVLLAALITFLLFYFMQFLIKSESDTPQTINAVRILDSTVPDFPPYLVIEEERPEPIEKEKIRLVSKPTRNTDFPTGPIIRLVPEKPPLDASKEGLLPMTNNIITPLIRTTPNYPSRALQRGLEGFVELSFTVGRFGSVINLAVITAEPEGVFDRAALQAIRRWKYSPAVNNGQTIETYDVRHRIVFQMDPSSR